MHSQPHQSAILYQTAFNNTGQKRDINIAAAYQDCDFLSRQGQLLIQHCCHRYRTRSFR
jgi:hypothetical protein